MNVQVLSKHQIWAILCTILLIVLAAAGCSQGESAANPAPSAVEVVEVQQKDVPIYGEWIGTLDGLVNAAGFRLSAEAGLHRRLPRQKRPVAV